MRLSDAIAMGRTVIEPKGGSNETENSGCALTMGAVAAGLTKDFWKITHLWQKSSEQWPWLLIDCQNLPCGCADRGWGCDGARNYFWAIIHIFDAHVTGCYNDFNLDQLIDWVRSVEPAEPEQLVVDQNFCDETAEKVQQ